MLHLVKLYTPINAVLLNHIHTSLQESIERSALQHTVLQQGEVDELMNDIVVLGIARDDIIALSLLVADSLLCVVNIILLFLGNLLWLLLALLLMKHCKASFLTLDFCKDWLQCIGGVSLSILQYLLHQSVV